MAEFTLDDLNAITSAAQDDILHIRNTSGLDKKITVANLLLQLEPIGVIKMFDGSGWTDNSTIVGWYACIAANAGQSCPDLENQFIKGSAPADVLATGGAATHTLITTEMPGHTHVGASHTHSINHDHGAASTGAHTHGIGIEDHSPNNFVYACRGSSSYPRDGTMYTDSKTPSINLPSYSGTSGARSASTSGSTGGDGSHNNEPQYYKLIFIRKCV